MPCKRCSICGLNLPKNMTACPVCDEPLWLNAYAEEDEMWHWKATNLIQMRDAQEERNEQPYFMLVQAKEDEQGFFIDRYEAYRVRGNRILREGDVIELPSPNVDDQASFLWVILYTDRRQGRYYIRPMVFPGSKREVTINRPGKEPHTDELVLYDAALWERRDGD